MIEVFLARFLGPGGPEYSGLPYLYGESGTLRQILFRDMTKSATLRQICHRCMVIFSIWTQEQSVFKNCKILFLIFQTSSWGARGVVYVYFTSISAYIFNLTLLTNLHALIRAYSTWVQISDETWIELATRHIFELQLLMPVWLTLRAPSKQNLRKHFERKKILYVSNNNYICMH